MVVVRVTRQALEVLFQSPVQVRMVRQEMEILLSPGTGYGDVRVTRQAAEVLLQVFDRVSMVRQEMEIMFDQGSGYGSVEAVRQAIEVLFEAPTVVELNRQEMEVLYEPGTGSGSVRLTRQGAEVLIKRGIPAPVPLPLPAGLDFFVHNWDAQMLVETAWMTDVTTAADPLTEERRQLLQKPVRRLRPRWTQSGKEELDRLYVGMRRFTRERTAIPLYPDTTRVNADSPSVGQTIFCDTRYRRFFPGGRIIVYRRNPMFVTYSSALFYTISEVHPDRIIVNEASLGVTLGEQLYRVAPLVDVEQGLEVSFEQPHYGCSDVRMDMEEVVGPSSLPPTHSGPPEGFATFDGDPIFNLEPNWDDLTFDYMREGVKSQLGKAGFVYARGPRERRRQMHKFLFGDRSEFWQFVRFWDSRRGRLMPFWVADQEKIWDVLQVAPAFVSIAEFGIFSDFIDGFDHVAIVMKDGTTHIRAVNTIQDLGGIWRLTTIGDPLPSIDLTRVQRVTRARRCRWESDALQEVWSNEGVCQVELTSLELFREGEHTL